MIFYFLGILAFIFVLGVVIFPVETDSLRSSIGISKDPSTKFLHGHKIVASKQKYQASLFYSSKPLENYDESIRRVHERISTQEIDAADYGHSIIMTHGHKTEKVIVFYHGYTNCPRQFEDLGKKFFEQGYNVYVPRVPHHGINDLFTKEIGRLTIRELMQVCDESVDIARGLGKKVTVLGISMGGVMAAWNAQFREDLDKAVLVVPSFGWYFLPGIIKPLVNVSFLFPNSFLWWDPVKREKRRSPFSMYHRFSTHGMGHILRLGLSVFRASKKQAPSRYVFDRWDRTRNFTPAALRSLITWETPSFNIVYSVSFFERFNSFFLSYCETSTLFE